MSAFRPHRMSNRLRTLSWVVSAASLVLPAAYYLYSLQGFRRWVEQSDGPTCGMPMLAAVMLSVSGAALLSLVATALNVQAWRRQNLPITKLRWLEWGLLSLPWMATVGWVLHAVLS